jgi:hypothetical protein
MLPTVPGAITTVPAVGLPIPNLNPILLPDEPPVIGPGGSRIIGHVLVELYQGTPAYDGALPLR